MLRPFFKTIDSLDMNYLTGCHDYIDYTLLAFNLMNLNGSEVTLILELPILSVHDWLHYLNTLQTADEFDQC